MSHGIKITNEYSASFGKLYAQTPKSVFAAVAYSYVSNAGENQNEAIEVFLREWETLWSNGIVPQKPPSLFAER